jgi:hypothetical protein
MIIRYLLIVGFWLGLGLLQACSDEQVSSGGNQGVVGGSDANQAKEQDNLDDCPVPAETDESADDTSSEAEQEEDGAAESEADAEEDEDANLQKEGRGNGQDKGKGKDKKSADEEEDAENENDDNVEDDTDNSAECPQPEAPTAEDGQPEQESPSPDVAPSFQADIAPLLERSCNDCHSAASPAGDIATDSYEAAQANIEVSIDSIDQGRMPIGNYPDFSADELQLLIQWRDSGMEP